MRDPSTSTPPSSQVTTVSRATLTRGLLEPMLAASGFEIVTAEFSGRLYGAYTCVKS